MNWENEDTGLLQEELRKLVRHLERIWRKLRRKKRMDELEDRVEQKTGRNFGSWMKSIHNIAIRERVENLI